jgi:hypothetical protein
MKEVKLYPGYVYMVATWIAGDAARHQTIQWRHRVHHGELGDALLEDITIFRSAKQFGSSQLPVTTTAGRDDRLYSLAAAAMACLPRC